MLWFMKTNEWIFGNERVMNKGASPKGVTHTHLCLSMMPPNKPIETYAGYKQRGGAYTIEMSRVVCPVQSPSHWWRPQVERQVLVLSQAAAVQWSRSLAGLQARPVVQPGLNVGWSEH